MSVTVDKNKCIGCGLCSSVCPEVFELDNDGKARAKNPNGDKKFKCVKEAVGSCPVQAIVIS
ncbi:MAG: ferredoxin [Candidatus Aenigmatarchaeota archaeon]